MKALTAQDMAKWILASIPPAIRLLLLLLESPRATASAISLPHPDSPATTAITTAATTAAAADEDIFRFTRLSPPYSGALGPSPGGPDPTPGAAQEAAATAAAAVVAVPAAAGVEVGAGVSRRPLRPPDASPKSMIVSNPRFRLTTCLTPTPRHR